MLYLLRSFVQKHPLVHKFYIALTNRSALSYFPKKETDLRIAGFPRSGNTFFSTLVNYFFSELKVSHHLHSISSLKLAKKYDCYSLILIRRPEQSISSLIIRYHLNSSVKSIIKFTTRQLVSYRRFYNYALRLERKNIINFDNLVNNPVYYLEQISFHFYKIKKEITEKDVEN